MWKLAKLILILVLAAHPVRGADVAEELSAARTHLQKGRIAEAIDAYEALAKTDADAGQVTVGLSQCLEAEGKLDEAATLLTKAAADSEDAAIWARLAEIQFAQGEFSGCEKSLETALKIDPDQPAARLIQAFLWTETGRLKEANEEYRWFVRYYNRVQPEDAETLMHIAAGAAQYARWNKGSQIFSFVINTLCPDALKADENYWQASLFSGNLLLEKFNRAQALPEFRQALAINPRATEVFVALATAARQDFDLDEAADYADRALAINPNSVAALRIKADLARNAGEIPKALGFAEKALKVNPHDQRTLALQATCFLLIDGEPPVEQLDELLSHLDAIEQVEIDKPGRFTALLMDLAKRNPAPGYFLTELGSALEEHRKFVLAERFYQTASKVMPQLSEPKTALGMLYMRIGKTDEAGEILDSAFEADPFHVRVSNMRKVVKLLDSYEIIATDHFVIRVDASDRILGQYMADYLEEQYPLLVKQFGFEPPTRTQFEIYNTHKGLSAHQWFSARMVGLPWIQTIGASTGMIVALASPTSGGQQFNWARVLKHEFVHILTLQQTKFNIPHWYTEALAVLNEGYPRPAIWNQLLLERVPKGELMNLDTLNLGFIRPKTPLDWQMAYCQSHLYAQYMIDQFGKEKIASLLNAYQRNLSTDQAIPEVFGVSKKEFEAGYLKYIQELTATLRAVSGEPEISLAEAEKAHLADPKDTSNAGRYAYELWKAKQFKEARQVAEAANDVDPKQPLAAVVMAQLVLRAEDEQSAIAFLETALDREQPHPQVLELLANLKLGAGELKSAAVLFELGHARDPANEKWVKGMALAYLKLEEPEKLRSTLEILSQMDADDPVVRKKLAQITLENGEFDEAVRYGKMAIQIDVMDPETHRLLGEGYLGLKQGEKAVTEFEVAVELLPDDVDLQVGLAKAMLAAKQTEKAKSQLESILKMEPDHTEAIKLLERLKKDASEQKSD